MKVWVYTGIMKDDNEDDKYKDDIALVSGQINYPTYYKNRL